MSSEIDYDELDQAVTGAMDSEQPKDPEPTRAEDSPSEPDDSLVPEQESAPEPKKTPPKPRGLYMDMIRRPKRPASKKPAPAPKPTKVEHTTEFGVIEEAPLVTPAAPTPPKPQDTAVADFISEPTPYEHIVPTEPTEPAPNPDNFITGGSSPFIENAVVEKRPLGDYVPEGSPSAVKSTKNVYSQRSVLNSLPKQDDFTAEIVPDAPKKSNFLYFVIVLIVIALGAAAGAAAWYIWTTFN